MCGELCMLYFLVSFVIWVSLVLKGCVLGIDCGEGFWYNCGLLMGDVMVGIGGGICLEICWVDEVWDVDEVWVDVDEE